MVKIALQFLPFFAFVKLTLKEREFDIAIYESFRDSQMTGNRKNRDAIFTISRFSREGIS